MALGTGASIFLMASMAAAGSQIAGGISANRAAQQSAGLQEEQARIQLAEAEREATQKSTERRKFLAEQRMAYLANGVSLIGTPSIVQEDTFKEFQMEIDAIRKSGVAKLGLGLKQAAITRSSGRSELISGITGGVTTAGSSIYTATRK